MEVSFQFSDGTLVCLIRSAGAVIVQPDVRPPPSGRFLRIPSLSALWTCACEADVVGSDGNLDLAVILVLSADTRSTIAVAESGHFSALKVSNQMVPCGSTLQGTASPRPPALSAP